MDNDADEYGSWPCHTSSVPINASAVGGRGGDDPFALETPETEPQVGADGGGGAGNTLVD